LAKYISKLWQQGFDFKTRRPCENSWEKYIEEKGKLVRHVVQHGLVEGVKLDKTY
jgi:hypothetical protein